MLRVTGEVGNLPQAITLGTHQTVADLLGIGRVRAALHAIEGGDVSPEAFAQVGDDWDVEQRALAWLDRLGLAGPAGLDSTVAAASARSMRFMGLVSSLERSAMSDLLVARTTKRCGPLV